MYGGFHNHDSDFVGNSLAKLLTYSVDNYSTVYERVAACQRILFFVRIKFHGAFA